MGGLRQPTVPLEPISCIIEQVVNTPQNAPTSGLIEYKSQFKEQLAKELDNSEDIHDFIQVVHGIVVSRIECRMQGPGRVKYYYQNNNNISTKGFFRWSASNFQSVPVGFPIVKIEVS